MFSLSNATKAYREAGSLNEQINLLGFLDDHLFLTKSGDVGAVLSVSGIDYEGLDGNGIDQCTKRLEAAFKVLDDQCRIYQYLFKRNHPHIPHREYQDPVVNAAIRNRIAYFNSKSDKLYSLEIFYVVVLETAHREKTIRRIFGNGNTNGDGHRTWKEFLALVSTKNEIVLMDEELRRAQALLNQKISSFLLQVNDFLPIRLLDKAEAFRALRRILNFAPQKLELARLKHDTFLDFYLCDSHLECDRGFLRLDDYYLKVLTLKEPPSQSFPLIFQKLLEVEANFFVVTEWKREDTSKTRGRIHSRRRHFHNTKRSLLSYLNTSDAPASAQDVLVDNSKEAQIQALGKALTDIEINGNYFGEFSLSIIVYDLDLSRLETAYAEFYKVFAIHDAELYQERYNLLNAYLATVPGNSAFNLRRILTSNANYADYSFLFTLDSGRRENEHLRQEYLALLETNHKTPYFLNLHYRDVAHTIILGRTGSGKSFTLNFLITNLQKYEPYTFIFDLGGSFESLTRLFRGSYLRVGLESPKFKINPFALPPIKRNLDFLALFVRVLAESQGQQAITAEEERELYEQIQTLYELEDSGLHTLTTLGNMLPRSLDNRLYKWKEGGQFGFLFDNAEDTISFSRFQCFDFQGMREYPQLLEPLLFYILHRADAIICDPAISHVFKAFLIDEAWVFLRNPRILAYIVEALKTWRKHNAALVLSTQSLDELRKSEILDVLLESCPTKIFLANPDMDLDLYSRQFHLNDHEIELISGLVPKQQMLIKTPDSSKVANLNVDSRSYWLYTNDPLDNRRRDEAFRAYGFEKGLDVLAAEQAQTNLNHRSIGETQ
ncbi:MAG TPA: type IV secretion system DNA-binding domain-containing protein [Terriglobales bacterium]|nr:type IV secretion system DNA-binding domain-containing protein [Terriglobales bacterium]